MIFLFPGSGASGNKKQQVDVRARGEQAASVPSDGDDGQPRRGLDARVNEPPRHIVQRANELILEIAQPLGAATSAPALLERLSRLGAALIEHGAEEIDGGGPKRRVVALRLAPDGFEPFLQPDLIHAAA